MTLDFSTVYEKHFRYVKLVCLRMVRDNELAEDLAQEAFIQIWKNLDTFRAGSKFTTWIYRIAVNQCLMHLRKRKLDAVDLDHPDLRNLRASVADPNDTILLERVIAKLPKGYKKTFLLREVEGFTFLEIAEMLDFSEGNAKSQNFKAKAKLRDFIAKIK